MSMLSNQADNLRLMARLVRDYDYSEISRMLREAANTITALSDKLQGVMSELLPCPFCGGKASRIAARQSEDGTYYPAACGCSKCGIWRYGENDYGHNGFATKEDCKESMEQAASKWNTRMPEIVICGDIDD